MAATTWNSFTSLFAQYFPLFKGPKLMGIASPYWHQCKGANSISFDRYGITADGKYISIIPRPIELPVPVFDDTPIKQIEKRGPNPYTMYVNSHKDRTSDIHASINAWKYINGETRARYRTIIENNQWLAFYRFLPFTKKLGLTPFQHLSEFEKLSPALKNVLNH